MIKPYTDWEKMGISAEEMQKCADRGYEQIGADYRQAGLDKNKLAEEIDSVLKAGETDMFEQLRAIVSGELFQNAKEYDDELLTFSRVLSIYEEEKKTGKKSLLEQVASIAELREIYVRTFFGMRRLELDMPRESLEEFRQLISEYDMSAIYLINVMEWHPFYKRDYLARQFGIWLSENGMEALFED